MFTRRALLLALWTAAVGTVPALTMLNPIVKPAIDKVPDKPLIPAVQPYVTPNNPAPFNPNPIKLTSYQSLPTAAFAGRFDDGRICPDGAVCEGVAAFPKPCLCGCGRTNCSVCNYNCSTSGAVCREERRWFPGKRIGQRIGQFFRNGGFIRRWFRR